MQHNRSLWPVWMLGLVFLTPALAAFIILQNVDRINFGTTQHGTLVKPSTELSFRSLTAVKEPSSSLPLVSKWHVIYVTPLECDSTCQQYLKLFSNMHTLLNKEQDRVILAQTVASAIQPAVVATNSVILLDPFGRLVMRYPVDTDPKGILSDLRRLLKYSHAT